MDISTAPHGSSLTRRELQSYLKQWERKATGKTEVLLEAYENARQELRGGGGGGGGGGDETVARLPTAAAETMPTPEKRVKRFRPLPTASIRQRIDRARSQRLYLVQHADAKTAADGKVSCDFVVLGSTGNLYNVHIGQRPQCSCPDNAKGNLCKHILFVLLKVVGLPSTSPLVYQAAYLQTELNEIFEQLRSRRVGGTVMANDRVKNAFASLQKGEEVPVEAPPGGVERKALTADDSDCPICFDEMKQGSSLTYCRAACGTNFHVECIKRWLQQQHAKTCPNCRQSWQQDGKTPAKRGAFGEEGYANVGGLQGQSDERDTSTYADWSDKRRRRYY